MSSHRPGRAIYIVVTSILLVASACTGGSSGASPTPGTQQSSATLPQSPTITAIKQSGVLRVGVNVAPPWLLQNTSTNKWFGPGTIWVEELAKRLGVTVEYREADFSLLVPGLQAGQFDITATALFETPTRLAVVDFVTWSKGGVCYLVLKTNTKINQLSDMNDPSVRIGVWQGSAGETEIPKSYPKATINAVPQGPGQIERLADIRAGRIDVTFLDSPLGPVYEKKFPDIKVLPGGGQQCLEQPDLETNIGAAVRKGDAGWKEFVSGVISGMQTQINAEILKYSTAEYLLP